MDDERWKSNLDISFGREDFTLSARASYLCCVATLVTHLKGDGTVITPDKIAYDHLAYSTDDLDISTSLGLSKFIKESIVKYTLLDVEVTAHTDMAMSDGYLDSLGTDKYMILQMFYTVDSTWATAEDNYIYVLAYSDGTNLRIISPNGLHNDTSDTTVGSSDKKPYTEAVFTHAELSSYIGDYVLIN